MNTIEELPHPFGGSSKDLWNLYDKLIISGSRITELVALKVHGKEPFKKLVCGRLEEQNIHW